MKFRHNSSTVEEAPMFAEFGEIVNEGCKPNGISRPDLDA